MLGWEPKYTLAEMCASSWNWQSQNPQGYEPAADESAAAADPLDAAFEAQHQQAATAVPSLRVVGVAAAALAVTAALYLRGRK